jgi:alkylation response protein AidB-like acyl-CoA dehydrogenase
MAQVIADRRDVDFVLHEQFEVEEFFKNSTFDEFNRKTIDMIISEARNFAIKEILPTLTDGDRHGVILHDGRITLPESFYRAFELFRKGEWTAITAEPELGGQGLPYVIAQAVQDYMIGANYVFYLYGISGSLPGEIIELYGTEQQKDMFLKNVLTGLWGGTMVLTEPGAGSDVGALTTTAVRNADGTYSISGNKIFITNGEHDLTENIIHPVLARVEGARQGSKGISLFLVPKIWVNEDGTLGEHNDVVCTGIEEKMGMHASSTCSLAFGGKGQCRGLLVGKENMGMRVMFALVNSARILIGAVGQTSASAAYLHAVNYANERHQGKDLEKAFQSDAPQVPIIKHPDVRRMLMWMKAHVEGMRSLIYYGALCIDRVKCSGTEEEKSYFQDILDLLTPVIKSYCTDKGVDICSEAIQVFGGYGYTKDFPVEQLLRDVRVTTIYEGTNGIQAIDLLGRKLGMKNGAVFMNFTNEIITIVDSAKENATLSAIAEKVEKTVQRFGELSMFMGKNAMSENFKSAFLNAVPFQEIMGDICMAWMLLWRATAASKKLSAKVKEKDLEFYRSQIQTANYFINSILPITHGKMESVFSDDVSALEITAAGFGG